MITKPAPYLIFVDRLLLVEISSMRRPNPKPAPEARVHYVADITQGISSKNRKGQYKFICIACARSLLKRKKEGKDILILFQEEFSAFFKSHYGADFSVVE